MKKSSNKDQKLAYREKGTISLSMAVEERLHKPEEENEIYIKNTSQK